MKQFVLYSDILFDRGTLGTLGTPGSILKKRGVFEKSFKKIHMLQIFGTLGTLWTGLPTVSIYSMYI